MIDYRRITLEEVKNPERFSGDTAFLKDAVAYAVGKTAEIRGEYVHNYPTASSTNLMYGKLGNSVEDIGGDWVTGFWTGMLWLSYELTGDEIYRAIAEAQFDDYKQCCDEPGRIPHHDVGFLYIPSILAQYKLTGNPKAKKLALKAAKVMSRRFAKKAGIIQVRNRDGQGNFIVDCCMNVPLLFWRGLETGDRDYIYMAYSHLCKAIECMVRDDASTYQCFQIDELTGEPVKGWQGQGENDDSCWARGHAWIIYGLAIGYRYTQEKRMLEVAKRVANYYLNRQPSDEVCCWDLIYTDDSVQRDTSAAPVAACGLLELSKYLEESDPLKQIYHNAGVTILRNLAESYTTKGLKSNGLLQHGVYCKAGRGGGKPGLGDDECCIWGDYFYLEGLTRLSKDWKMYW